MTQIQLRRAAASSWTSVNPILALGEVGIETDTRKLKVGDGSTQWTGLSYTVVAWSDVSGKPAVIASGATQADARTAIGLGSVDNTSDATKNAAAVTLTNKTLTNPTVNAYTEGVVTVGTVSSSHTLAITAGTVITATLTASTACTFTMPTAAAGKSFTLLLKQAASTGGGTATFTGVKWGSAGAPTVTATAGKMDIFSFFSDGTNWYGSVAQGYTP